jgi:hypothetical protein
VNNDLERTWKEAVAQFDAPGWNLSRGTEKCLVLGKTAIVLARIKVRCLPNISEVSPLQKSPLFLDIM